MLTQEIVGGYVRKMGGPYAAYGEGISQLCDTDFELLLLEDSREDIFKILKIDRVLHQNMLQLNLNDLLTNENLRIKLTLPLPPVSSQPSPSAASTLPFPKDGIALSAVDSFIELCGGKELFVDLTTTEVNIEAQKPFTYSLSCSYCDHLKERSFPGVGKATVFISHAWKYKFLDVLDAIRNHFRDEDPIIWFDLFTNNQHDAPDLDFGWWSTTFQEAIREIGTTVMVLSPWSDPIPLTRAWCLYEIYCAIHTKSTFQVAMSSSENQSFMTALGQDINCTKQLLSVVNVQRSEAWNPLDRQRIFEIVDATIGFDEINSLVSTRLREWIISATAEAYNNSTDAIQQIEIGSNLGLLYLDLCQYPLAEERLRSAYEQVLAREGKSENSVRKLNNLAILYERQRDYKTCIPLLEECVNYYNEEQLREKKSNSNAYLSKISLAICLMNTGRYQEALESFQVCSNYFNQSDPHIDSYLSCTYNLAVCHDYLGHLTEAHRILSELYKYLSEEASYGSDHYDTLRLMTSLGSVCERMGDSDRALELYRKAFETKAVKYGRQHDSTLTTELSYGKFLLTLALDVEAIPLLRHCFDEYTRREDESKLSHSAYYLIIALMRTAKYDDAILVCNQCLARDLMNSSHAHFEVLNHKKEICEEILESLRVENAITRFPKLLDATLAAHDHPLELSDTPYEGGCLCDRCNRVVIKWVYHCGICGYDCHPKCVLERMFWHDLVVENLK
jgi:tetratricopeptide (TPR) repeat protein